MMKFKQLYRHNPPHSYGDCFRTVLGCLLDLPPEKVPHFYDGYDKDDDCTAANQQIGYWLSQQGYVMVQFAYECPVHQVLEFMGTSNPNVYYLITGRSVTGNNHVCVGLGDKIVWDPAPEGKGLIGPNSNGQVIIEVLVPTFLSSGWSYPKSSSSENASETGCETTRERPAKRQRTTSESPTTPPSDG